MLIDTHCHLDEAACAEGADTVIERARALGVSAFVCIGVGGLPAARQALALAARRRDVVATVGVHPHDAATLDETLEAELSAMIAQPSCVAVGEIGLDFHYDHSPRTEQDAVFRRFVQIAKRASKPIVVHTRSAPAATLEVLEAEGAREVGGVIHCFSEDRDFARRALDLGFDLSFSGIVTFKTAHAIQDVASWAPLDRILLETDSPYLAPVPLRGRKCEPAYIAHTADYVARLRGISRQVLEDATTRNACRRFGRALAEAAETVQTSE
jgi:TatD DNase family protein